MPRTTSRLVRRLSLRNALVSGEPVLARVSLTLAWGLTHASPAQKSTASPESGTRSRARNARPRPCRNPEVRRRRRERRARRRWRRRTPEPRNSGRSRCKRPRPPPGADATNPPSSAAPKSTRLVDPSCRSNRVYSGPGIRYCGDKSDSGMRFAFPFVVCECSSDAHIRFGIG